MVPEMDVCVSDCLSAAFCLTPFSRTLSLSNGSVQVLEPFDVSGTAGFNAIDEFRITPAAVFQIGYLGIDNLDAVNFVPEPSSMSLSGGLAMLLGWRRRRYTAAPHVL